MADTSDRPENSSLTVHSGAAVGRMKPEEVQQALTEARGNLAFHQVGGSARRIEEAEANVSYLESLLEEKEEAAREKANNSNGGGE